ncbi:hypothetical protein Tco_0850454 [Tanacetum coccineum]
MTLKLDDIIELPKSLSKQTNKEDLECGMVKVKIPRCMSFLGDTNTYNEKIGNIDIIVDKVENPSPQSTSQVLSSFEVYTLPVTYPKEVKETIGIPMEVEPLGQTQLEDVGLDTCNYDIPLSSREVPTFDELNPQPSPLPNFPSLDVSLGEERGTKPPIKPYSPESFRMKVVDNLTIHTPPSPHMFSFHPKDVYCHYHPCIDNPRKHHGLKPARIDAITMKMDAQYKEMKSRIECSHCRGNHSTADCNDDDTPVSQDEEAKFMQNFRRMPNYDKFLKELDSNKHKLEQISLAFLSDESPAIIQNKVPPKLRDPGSFLIPCTFSKTFSCNALADSCAHRLVFLTSSCEHDVVIFNFKLELILIGLTCM